MCKRGIGALPDVCLYHVPFVVRRSDLLARAADGQHALECFDVVERTLQSAYVHFQQQQQYPGDKGKDTSRQEMLWIEIRNLGMVNGVSGRIKVENEEDKNDGKREAQRRADPWRHAG